MEKILLTILSLLLVVGCSKTEAQTYQFAEEFYNNGLPKSFNTYKISKGMLVLVNKTGWYEDGQKYWEKTFKDGQLDGLYTEWFKNGQEMSEGTYKDGKRDGLWSWWDDNGQKYKEGIYKDGKRIDSKSFGD